MNFVLSNTFICILTLWSMEHQRIWSRICRQSIVSLGLTREKTIGRLQTPRIREQKDNKKAAAADLKMQPQPRRVTTDKPKRISKYEKPLFSLLETELRASDKCETCMEYQKIKDAKSQKSKLKIKTPISKVTKYAKPKTLELNIWQRKIIETMKNQHSKFLLIIKFFLIAF